VAAAAPTIVRLPVGRAAYASVPRHASVAVVANEVGATQHVLDFWPAVRMNGRRISGLDPCLENPDALVLEEHMMVRRCGGDRIELVRPLPPLLVQI
jgi:hypothetical protein